MAFNPLGRRHCPAYGLLIAALLTTFPAAADEPSAADKETARALMERGHEAYDGGHYPDAVRPFEQAHGIMQLPTTGLWLARAHEKLGRLLEARDVALSVGRLPVKGKEAESIVRARKDAESLAQALAPRIPTLTVQVDGPSPQTVTLSIDGAALTGPALGVPRKLDPGSHVVTARADGFAEARTEVDLAEGRSETVTLHLDVNPQGGEGATSTSLSETQSGTPTLAYVGFGLAALGTVAGSVTGILALSRASDAKALCTDGRCPASSKDDIDSSNTFADVSTISFGVGLAGLALGVVVLATTDDSPAADSKPALQAELGLGALRVRGSF